MVYTNNINNDINNITKKNIDITLLMLGKELILPNESLIFYHSSIQKFENINNLGNWFSPIKIKEKDNYYTNYNIYTHEIPLWSGSYDFRFINKKPLKLLLIKTYRNDITSYKLKNMISIINNTMQNLEKQDLEQDLENPARKCSAKIKKEFEGLNPSHKKEFEVLQLSQEDRHFLLGQEQDPEYVLAYYLCKYSSFDGWITESPYLGFCMLKKGCLKKLKLVSVSEPPNKDNIIMYYTSKQWKEQFI